MSGGPVALIERKEFRVLRMESIRTLVSARRPACDGSERFPIRRCVVLDAALVTLTIVVFALLALVLKGLERL